MFTELKAEVIRTKKKKSQLPSHDKKSQPLFLRVSLLTGSKKESQLPLHDKKRVSCLSADYLFIV
jgi:hypothetical protein